MMKIGVVIPTLDEEAMIDRTLRVLRERGRPAVTVVADCGSVDRTRAIAARAGVVVRTGDGLDCRAAALNAGAERAVDLVPDLDAIFFLHADAHPTPGWDEAIATVLADARVVGGAFDFGWDLTGARPGARRLLLAIRAINRVRMRITHSYYGDQGIFVRPGALAAVGGVPDVTLLEDCALCRRLRRVGRLRLARGLTTTSPRRFLHHGVVRQAMIDAVLLAANQVGLQPARLHAWYNREKGDAPAGERCTIAPRLGD